MIEDLLRYLPQSITKEHLKTLNELEKSDPRLYKEIRTLSFDALKSMDWCDAEFCKKCDIDYVDCFKPENITKLMIAYLEKSKAEKNLVYTLLHSS